MKETFKRFEGMSSEVIVRTIELEQEMASRTFNQTADFMRWFHENGKALSDEWLRHCATTENPRVNRYHALLAYAFRTGDREMMFRYLERQYWLDKMRMHFPERVTPELVRRCADHWLAKARKNPEGEMLTHDAYEAYRELGDEKGMDTVRRLAVNLGHGYTVDHCGLSLNREEKLQVARAMLARPRDAEYAGRYIFLHDLEFLFRPYLETRALSRGYEVWAEEGPKFGIVPTVKHLLALLKNASLEEKLAIYEVLSKRNLKWWGKVQEAAGKLRAQRLERGDIEGANLAGLICNKPLTAEELIAYYRTSGNHPQTGKKALAMAAKLIAKRHGGSGDKKTEVAA